MLAVVQRFRAIVAGAIGTAVIVGASLTAAPVQAQAPSILDIVAGGLADNPEGQATDRRWNDFDILADVVDALAPTDAAFRGLVADLSNTRIWRLSEADVLNTLVSLTADDTIKGALTTTVLCHVGTTNVTDLFSNRTNIPTAAGEGIEIRPIPLRFSAILRDGDPTDFDPFVVGKPITASNGTVYVIAGVLRPIELNGLFPLG